jgi:hypothetical protein
LRPISRRTVSPPAGLDLADVEVLHRHAALDELRLEHVEQRRHLEVAVGDEEDLALGAVKSTSAFDPLKS